MGDGEPLIVDFDSFSKGMSFYSPEHPQKGFRVPTSHQQLDHSHSGASTDPGEQLYSSPDSSSTEHMDKVLTKTSLENSSITEQGETKSELQNSLHGGKENGSRDSGMDSLMTSLGQLALGQSGAMSVRRSGSWDEQSLSTAMYHLLAQSGSGHFDGNVESQHRMGTTTGNMSAHSPHQMALSSPSVTIQQGSASHNNLEPYQSWNHSGVPVQGSWARQNVHYNGSWVPNRRAMAYIPSGQLPADSSVITPKLRQNSPFPKSLQHLVATNKNSELQSCGNTVRSGTYSNVYQVRVYVIVIELCVMFCFINAVGYLTLYADNYIFRSMRLFVVQDSSARFDALRFLAGDAGLSDALRTPEVQQYLG